MKKTTNRIASIGAGLALAAGLLVAAPAPVANAGTCTAIPGPDLCGKVTLLSGSSRSLKIGNNWNGEVAGTIKYLRAGETSTRFFKDTDGFEVPSGHHAHVGTLTYKPGYDYKVRDGQHIRVTLHRGSKH